MFEINSQYKVDSSLPIIRENYQVLHFDEFPILFSGTNKFANKLIGSLAYEDYENDSFRYFIIIVDDKQYSKFFNGGVSYLNLIKECEELFIVDKDINDNVLSSYHIPLTVLPSEYLPLQNSFIPNRKIASTSLNFGFSLKGKLANLHKAFVHDINSVNQKIYSYLEESIEVLRNLSLDPQIYSQPSRNGSYRLNFDIELKQDPQLAIFQVDPNKVGEFVNQYLQYIAYSLPNEIDGFFIDSPSTSKNFQLLQESLANVYKSGSLPTSSTITDLLVDNINTSAHKLSEITEYLKTSESFDSIEIGNYITEDFFSSIGLVDGEYKSSVIEKLHPDENLLVFDEKSIVSDETPQNYRILVYKLNRYSGKAGARLYYDEENFNIVRLHIDRGDKELSNSVYTKSLDEDKVVDVRGIATKINGVYKKLDCYL